MILPQDLSCVTKFNHVKKLCTSLSKAAEEKPVVNFSEKKQIISGIFPKPRVHY